MLGDTAVRIEPVAFIQFADGISQMMGAFDIVWTSPTKFAASSPKGVGEPRFTRAKVRKHVTGINAG